MIQDDWFPLVRGGSVHVRELSIALAEQFGHEIDIFTRALKQDGIRYTENRSYADGAVSVYRLKPCTEYWNPIGRLSSMLTPLLQLNRGKYDIIHGHTFLPSVPTWAGSYLSGSPNVLTIHGTAIPSGVGHDTSGFARIRRWIERLLLLEIPYDHLISVNRKHMDLLSGAHEKVSFVPNGVDLDRFEIERDTVSGRILYVGRLAPKKRVEDLIEAYAMAREDVPESELVIVGTGPMRGDLETLAARHGITEHVQFKGYVEDDAIPEYYASAELFVLPAIWEGHPLTLLEAWAAGTPVIATNVEGIAEFVNHEETGYLVPPKSPPELADGLSYALNHPKVTSKWGIQGKEVATSEYSWAQSAQKTNSVYRQMSRS
ncbi:glycosyltransferase family 4 protein [Haloarcula sp. 1CSR25-25]|uniref:glycosyltransferase family 4 protein n=1 Tax=Haloarcula sp. 1CSR25-25 TaxID=2862545 RepID=UPI002897B318|nr:glycosyltransferase family 4 protein [Haloarcula sp. 1CSR25-25]